MSAPLAGPDALGLIGVRCRRRAGVRLVGVVVLMGLGVAFLAAAAVLGVGVVVLNDLGAGHSSLEAPAVAGALGTELIGVGLFVGWRAGAAVATSEGDEGP